MKEIEGGTKNGKISCVCGLEELILLKCPYYLLWIKCALRSSRLGNLILSGTVLVEWSFIESVWVIGALPPEGINTIFSEVDRCIITGVAFLQKDV